MQNLTTVPSLADIRATHDAIAPFIHRTPVMTNLKIDQLAGAQVFFKCENLQKIGAFKMRGAASAALRLTLEGKRKGLATHSSGNHAQAVARAAQLLGIPAFIVMPADAPSIKKAATEGYGATIVFCEPTVEARETALEKVVSETGATFIHPYNDYNVIAGQATAGKELLEEVKDLDFLLVPVGGGGLASGSALIAHYLSPGTQVIGAEPERVDDAYRSLKSGKIEKNASIDTIADGLRTTLGPKTLEVLSRHLRGIITVEERRILETMLLVWQRMKIIIEPSSAVPLAALLKDPARFKGKRVGVVLSGGNVDLQAICGWLKN